MAMYSLHPLTERQIQGRKRAYWVALAVSVAVLAATAAAWMNLITRPAIRSTLFALSIAAVVAAMVAAFGLWNFQDLVRIWGRSAYEVTPRGVRMYSRPPLSDSPTLTLGLDSASEARVRRGETRFLPAGRIRAFRYTPNGSLLVRGRFGNGAICVPRTLDGLAEFRQELVAMGIPERKTGNPRWYAEVAAKWGAILLFLLAISYMFWGANVWGILAGAALYAGVLGWASWVAHRLHEGRSVSRSLLFLFVIAIVLINVGQRAWKLEHTRGDGTVHLFVSNSRR